MESLFILVLKISLVSRFTYLSHVKSKKQGEDTRLDDQSDPKILLPLHVFTSQFQYFLVRQPLNLIKSRRYLNPIF